MSAQIANVIARYRLSAATEDNPKASATILVDAQGVIRMKGGSADAARQVAELVKSDREAVVAFLTQRCTQCGKQPKIAGMLFDGRCHPCFAALAESIYPSPKRQLEAWAEVGKRTGHKFKACDVCNKEVLTKGTPKCRMTPGCSGSHVTTHAQSKSNNQEGRRSA